MGEQSVVLSPMLVEQEKRDELTSHLFITDIGYYPKAERHHRIRLKAIDQYVLIYCVDGAGFYVVDGKRYEVKKTNISFCQQTNRMSMAQQKTRVGQSTGCTSKGHVPMSMLKVLLPHKRLM